MAQTYKGGAKRSSALPPFDDIPYEMLEEIANRYGIGEVRYGRDNWKRGGPDFFRDALNHAIRHLALAGNRNESDESNLSNLGAAAWNIGIVLWWEKTGRKQWETKHGKLRRRSTRSKR